MSEANFDAVGVVEASYRLDLSDDAWVRAIVGQAAPALDVGLGVIAGIVTCEAGRVRLDSPVGFDLGHDAATLIGRVLETVPESAWPSMLFEQPRVGTHADFSAWGRENAGDRHVLDVLRSGLGPDRDLILCRATSRRHHGGLLFAGVIPEGRTSDARARARWRRLVAHAAAGYRLRRAIARLPSVPDRPFGPDDVVLDPSGRVHDARGDGAARSLRESLRAHVVRTERARGGLRRDDPDAALGAWPALVEGRWSLADHFERDGRRYVIARVNEPDVLDPRALTTRERAVAALLTRGISNKAIAYELGSSASTVGEQVSAIARKLRVRTRVELVQLLRRLAREPSASG